MDLIQSKKLSGLTRIGTENLFDFFTNYLSIRRFFTKKFPTRKKENNSTIFQNEDQFWHATLNDDILFESKSIILTNFVLLEWIPQSPGLFYSNYAASNREVARTKLLEKSNERIVYDPHGKGNMIKGGIGCLRLSMKTIEGQDIKILCATSSGIAHKGIVLAIPSRIYSTIASTIENDGALVASIFGELRYWSSTIETPMYSHMKVPHAYILVRKIEIENIRFPKNNIDVTAAVTFEGTAFDEGFERSGTFFTFSHFNPTKKNSLNECVDWIKDFYVEGLYKGKVITDFDEKITHFENAIFPTKVVMDPTTSKYYLKQQLYLSGNYNAFVSIFIDSLYLKESDMKNISIVGDGNIVGNKNKIKSVLNLEPKEELREYILGELNLLKYEIATIKSIQKGEKIELTKSIEEAGQEVLSKNPDPRKIADSINDLKDILNSTGETFDQSKNWMKRISSITKYLIEYFPGIESFFSGL